MVKVRGSRQACIQILLRSSSGRSGKQIKVGGVERSCTASLGSCAKRFRKRDDIFAVVIGSGSERVSSLEGLQKGLVEAAEIEG